MSNSRFSRLSVVFVTATPKVWKESIGFPNSELYTESFQKKFIEKKIKYLRSFPDPENYRCGNQQPHNFFPVFANFRTLPYNSEKQNQLIRSRKIICNWEKCFPLDYLKRKDF